MTGGCHGVPSKQLGIAFACVIGAGIASVFGGLGIIFVSVRNNLFLAASLAFAAGIMLYISIVDIYVGKGVGHFVEAGYSEAHAFTYATICFFCGFPISWVLDILADRMSGGSHECPVAAAATAGLPFGGAAAVGNSNKAASVAVITTSIPPNGGGADIESSTSDSGLHQQVLGVETEQDSVKELRSRKLVHLGILAAMAVALHNMPEGLVTFVGYMDSAVSGITTAVAIAIHNIPEGMVIASAVYFGTGLRGRAILWAALAAFTEPLGGLIGLAVVCGGSMTPTVFGILFGLVGGIMTYVSVKELLPGARTFDPEDRVTTSFLTAGMIVMACSLVAIAFSAPPEAAEAAEEELLAAVVTLPPSAPPLVPVSP